VRQFVSPRFWAALAALLAVTGGLWFFLVRDHSQAIADVAVAKPAEHRIDVVSLVYSVDRDPEFAMVDGKAVGSMRLVLDGSRTMVVHPGTPGSVTCDQLTELARCVVAADLLGNAVVWFSVIPGAPNPTADLPGVVASRADNWVLLANGWEVRRSSVVERVCDDDTTGLDEFVQRFGGQSTAVFDFERQQVTEVVCPKATPATTTTTTPPVTEVVPSTSIGPAIPLTTP
jgi:hypothetical protein